MTNDSNAGRPVAAGHIALEIENTTATFDDLAIGDKVAPQGLDYTKLPKTVMVGRP